MFRCVLFPLCSSLKLYSPVSLSYFPYHSWPSLLGCRSWSCCLLCTQRSFSACFSAYILFPSCFLLESSNINASGSEESDALYFPYSTSQECKSGNLTVYTIASDDGTTVTFEVLHLIVNWKSLRSLTGSLYEYQMDPACIHSTIVLSG